ncbi:MAG: phosphoribosyltransferase [Parachlamydiaceae bacterium]
MNPLFYDRREAGRCLAAKFDDKRLKCLEDPIVLALARGGVAVGYEMAKDLSLPFNVIVPRKIGAPTNPELALGAIMESGEGFFDSEMIHALAVSQTYIAEEIKKEKALAQHRLALYRQCVPLPLIKNRTILLVDDGIATGATMLSAIKAMKQAGAKRVIALAPVCSSEAYERLLEEANEVICLYVKEHFSAVGAYYRYFNQIDDEDVVRMLTLFNTKEQSE